MKAIRIILLATMLGGFTACSQEKEKTKMENINQSEQREIIATTHRLTDLIIKRDIEQLDNLLDKNFTLTHITGYVQPKGEWLGEIEQESMKYYHYEIVSEKVEINGKIATFTGRNILDARIWGTRHQWRLQQVMTLEKRNGEWIVLSSVAKMF